MATQAAIRGDEMEATGEAAPQGREKRAGVMVETAD